MSAGKENDLDKGNSTNAEGKKVASNMDMSQISVRVVYALPDKQFVKELSLKAGTTVQDAIEQSALVSEVEDMVVDPKMVGIFGNKVSVSQLLQDGDRVEIYRPLIADPKEVRRQRAIRQAQSEQS